LVACNGKLTRVPQDEWYIGFGRRLCDTRGVLGLTEQQAAEGFGVTLRTYRKWEAGFASRSYAPMMRFQEKYHLTEAQLQYLYNGGD
jgi:transcriptional regulator with XRE-family HTH domain